MYIRRHFNAKGTVSKIQVTLDATITMPDSQLYPWNIYLINNDNYKL